jgi:L-fuconolactonase
MDDMQIIRRDFLPEDLLTPLIGNAIDGCVAIQADQSEKETDFLLTLADENYFVKGIVGWVDLCAENVGERLQFYANNPNFKGVRYILQGQVPEFMLQKSFQYGISQLRHYNLTYDILIYPHQLAESIKLVNQFPEQAFVLDHLAKPYIRKGKIADWKKDMEALAKHQNVCCKLSGMVTEADWKNWKASDIRPYMDVVLDVFGANRIMYGSDWPVCLLAGDYGQVLDLVQSYVNELSQPEQEAVMGNTAKAFYML